MLIRNMIAGVAAASLAAVPVMAQKVQPLRAGSATLAKPSFAGKRLGKSMVEPERERVQAGSTLAGGLFPLLLIGGVTVSAVAVAAVVMDSSPS